MNNYLQPGDTVDLTIAAGGSAGDAVQVGQVFGVLVNDVAAGDVGPVQLVGVHDLPKNTSEAWTEGQLVYWDGTELRNAAAATRLLVGSAMRAQLAADALGRVRLDGVSRADEV